MATCMYPTDTIGILYQAQYSIPAPPCSKKGHFPMSSRAWMTSSMVLVGVRFWTSLVQSSYTTVGASWQVWGGGEGRERGRDVNPYIGKSLSLQEMGYCA